MIGCRTAVLIKQIRPAIVEEGKAVRTIEKTEHDLERARRARNAWENSRGGQSNSEMAKVMVSALEKERSDAISNQGNHAG